MTLFSSARHCFVKCQTFQINSEDSDALFKSIKDEAVDLQKLREVLLLSNQECLTDEASFSLLDSLFPLLLKKNMQTSTYHIIEALANKLDHDQLLERLMDKLICFTWEYENEIGCFETARMFAIYIELFGRALEKVTKPKEWMLYLPFVTNCLKKALEFIEPILIKKSSLSHRARSSSTWDQVVFIVTDSVLDLAEFVHAVTVNKKPSEFPVGCEDIGSEDGDVRRRYLGYFLLNLIYEKIILNLDIQLSRTYFEKHHARYNVKGPKRQTDITTHCEYTTNIIQRCTKLSVLYGFSFSRMYQLLTSVCARQEFSLLSKEDEVLENDKQMINPRLYPLSYEGIACLFSMTLYDKKDVKLDMLPMAKDYIGISMNLILRPTEMINHVDKGIFVLLYFSDNINAAINMNDIDKEIRGPLGLESKFPVSRILQIISSVASICPDPSIRFFSYQLLQKFLDFSDDETCGFFLQELLDRCPFPSMRTAAIGLLKDQIDQSFNANCNNRQLFKSPLVVQVFVPIIFKINSIWLTRPSEFWNDYGHIMQALNLYYYLLLKDEQNNWTTVWIPQNIDQMKKKYLNPIKNCLNDIALIPTDDENSAFYTMQIEIMKDLLHKIDQKIN